MKSRRIITIAGAMALAMLLGGCSATLYTNSSSATNDDLYVSHNRKAIAAEKEQRRIREIEAQRAADAAEQARRQEVARQVAEINAERSEQSSDTPLSYGEEGSYESRLRGLSSANYTQNNDRTSSGSTDSRYASAYDPAYYDVTVRGDQIEVEPKYSPSLYGDWGSTNVTINLGLWGWGSSSAWQWSSPWWWGWSPSWNWYSGYYPYNGWNNWGWNWGWNNWYGWNGGWYGGWYPPYYGGGWYGPHYWGHHHYSKYNNQNTVYGRPRNNSNNVVRPSYMGGNGTSSYRRGSNSSYQTGTGSNSVSGSSGGSSYRRGSASSSGSSRPSGIGNSGSSSSNSNNAYRRSNSSSSGSSYTPPSNNNSNPAPSNNSYRRGGGSSSGSSYGGNSGGGGYSGGRGGGSTAPSSGGGGGGGYRR